MSFYFLFPKRIITTLNILKYKYIKSLYSVNAQYKEMFGVSNPLWQIFLIWAISQIVINIIAANKTRLITKNNHIATSGKIKYSIHATNERIPAPPTKPIAVIANPFIFPLLNKPIKDINPKIKAVTRNVVPKIAHGKQKLNEDNITPINIV